jgi:hypothetical protein
MISVKEMQNIINGISHHVLTSETPAFDSWRIALTNDAPVFFVEWNRPERFVYWETADLTDAQKIKAFFTNVKGMIGGITGELDDSAATAICIFPLS